MKRKRTLQPLPCIPRRQMKRQRPLLRPLNVFVWFLCSIFMIVSGRVPGDGVQEKKFIIIVLCFVDINNSQVTLTEFNQDNLRSDLNRLKDNQRNNRSNNSSNNNNIWQQIKNLCHRKRLPRNFPSQEWRLPPFLIQYHIHWSLGESWSSRGLPSTRSKSWHRASREHHSQHPIQGSKGS